ncbi:uncharacterized protein sytl2b [Pholidichthys leucotaenia]
MIDLSHLTEEEQGVIMEVLMRDAELKKSEEDRCRKLEKILTSDSQYDAKLKYLTGEWFYEAKSRRHMDKIHGSDIILASMKQGKANSLERNKLHLAEFQTLPYALEFFMEQLYQRKPTIHAEPISRVKYHSLGSANQTLESSSEGFRPVPKKRTFLSRRNTYQSENNGLWFKSTLYSRNDVSSEREVMQRSEEQEDPTQKLHGASHPVTLFTTCSLQDRENSSSVGTAMRQELSLPKSTVGPDPPVSYDLNFIDKSDQSTLKSKQSHVFKLSTQATSPTGDDEHSIAKVLDWFNRSTDSSDWLNTDSGPEVIKSSDKHSEVKLKGEDALVEVARNITSDGEKEITETKRNRIQEQISEDKELRAADRMSNKVRSQESAKMDTRERIHPQDRKDDVDENQQIKILYLKSFWEKTTSGPKIIVNRSVSPDEKGKKPAPLSREKNSDVPTVPATYGEKFTLSPGDEREQQLVISPQTDLEDCADLNNQQINVMQLNGNDSQHNSEYVKLLSNDRKSSDVGDLCVHSPSVKTALHPELKSIHLVERTTENDSVSESEETIPQTELPKTIALSQADTERQSRSILDSEKLSLSRKTQYVNYKHGENNMQIPSVAQLHRGLGDDPKRRDTEDKTMQSGIYQKRKEIATNKDNTNSPHSNRQGVPQQESIERAERIKQLKSFWEQERNKPVFYTGKPKEPGDGIVARLANQARLNKRFTKSEFDLTSLGNELGSEEADNAQNNPNFTIAPFNQRLDKISPNLGTSQAQFNTLREFWDEAMSDSKGSSSFDKSKSSKRKESLSPQLSSPELKGENPELYRVLTAVDKTRSTVGKSSPPPLNRSKLSNDRQAGSGSRISSDSKNNPPNYMSAESAQKRQTKRSSKESKRDEKSSKPQSNSGKEFRSPKSRKDSFGQSSSRQNSLRRAKSMFALGITENDQNQLKMDVSPVHSQSSKQRQSSDKAALSRRSLEETETQTPRARAFVPTNYRHYLGMADKTSVHTSLAPTVKDEESECKSGYELNLSGPVRASTPVNSEKRYSRKSNKMSQHPLWAHYSSSDTGQESSMSSTSETWSNSRNSSYRENDEENPVRKALRRAEARPKNLAKSLEDITASFSPRQERRQDPIFDRRISDAIPSPSPALYSNPDHLRKLSKSVPSFLQEEDTGGDTDSTCKTIYHRERLITGSSMSDLTNSSDMATVSSRSGSVMTIYSGEFENVEVQGSIQFSINYVHKLREFHIFVAQCTDLAAVNPKKACSDPYVKSYLVPDKANLGKRKTSVKKKTLNPTFNEILRYRVRMEYLKTQTLILSVWHHDTFGRNSFLGEVDMDLSKWDFDHTQMNYLVLKARTTPTLAASHERGEMKLAIRFLPQITHSKDVVKHGPSTGEIHIWVKECKNLPLIRATIDPYVKCFVLPDTSRKSRQKTRVLRRTVDPVFNHTMVYDGIREVDLTEACVELTVWDRDRLASNLLGGLRLGVGTGRSYGAVVDWMDSSPYEVALWERMMTSPNEWVEDVLPLRILNSAKTAFK